MDQLIIVQCYLSLSIMSQYPLYIYAYKPTKNAKIVKLGVTCDLKRRQSTFRQVTPLGRMVMAIEVSTRRAERVLFEKLAMYRLKKRAGHSANKDTETFKIPLCLFEMERAFLQTALETDVIKRNNYVLIDRCGPITVPPGSTRTGLPL